jgi:diguanylate cyclase (GGDEF)-like protein
VPVAAGRLAAAAFDALASEAAILDSDGVVVMVNEAWREFGRQNGASASCGVGSDYLGVCERSAADGDEIAGVVEAAVRAVLEGHAPRAALDYPCHSPAQERWFSLRAQPVLAHRWVLVQHDEITPRVQAADRLRHAATHDPLTGLANRALLQDRLGVALTPLERRLPSPVAVLVVDLDDFKLVNDVQGHLAGDVLLTALGARLHSLVRLQDTVARWGGDEFVMVLPGCSSDAAERMALRVRAAVAEPVSVRGVDLAVTASVGVAVGEPGCDLEELLARADRALLEAKARRAATGRG